MKDKIIYLQLAIISLMALFFNKSCNDSGNKQVVIDAITDSLKVSKDKLGRQIGEITDLRVSNVKYLKDLANKDSDVQKLLNEVKKLKDAYNGILVSSNTSDNGSTITTVIEGDTVIVNDTVYIYPTYKSEWDEKWSYGYIEARRDSIKRQVTLRNEFIVVQSYQREGFLKPKVGKATITNNNPNTVTTGLRTFSIDYPKSKVNIGPSLNYGISTTTFKPDVTIGVSVQYTMLRF